MTSTTAVRWAQGMLELLLPRACVSCERQMQSHECALVCTLCWTRLAMLPSPCCNRCGHPTAGRECRFCETLPPFVRSARSACWMPHEVASAIVHALKYHGWTGAAGGMAARMARLHWPPDVVTERSAIIPVPLASARERERGFNQAALLAAALAPAWRIPVWADALVRTRSTRTQTRLTPGERSANVRDAFEVPEGRLKFQGARERMRGLHLVLVDDVLTTGATLNACAAALFNAGARTISYVTFGRARASGDR
jgi:ComF family protein